MYKLPYFASEALAVLPLFLKAIDQERMGIDGIDFTPSWDEIRNDPNEATVILSGRVDQKIIFTYRYRPGEEGTRGSTDELTYIAYTHWEWRWIFAFMRHHCACFDYCNGTQYPFRPVDMDEREFRKMSEFERLTAIRAYLARKSKIPTA